MPMNDRYVSPIDEHMSELPLLLWDVISPIGPPVDRDDHEIAWPAECRDLPGDPPCTRLGQVGEEIDTRRLAGRRPIDRYAA